MVPRSKLGSKNRKYGRASRKPKTARYKLARRRERNKLKRILQSNGLKFAEEWAHQHHAMDLLRKAERKR